MTTELLRFVVKPHISFNLRISTKLPRSISIFSFRRRRNSAALRLGYHGRLRRTNNCNRIVSKSVEVASPAVSSDDDDSATASVLLDVTGMMCGACVSRVKLVLSSDERVSSVVVNMLTESAASRLKRREDGVVENVAESLAVRLTECGFPTKRRVSGVGVGENVNKWKEMLEKEALLVKSRNRVVIA